MAASLKLAVVLIVVLAGVLAWATFLEAAKGREFAQWYVYGGQWFIALLALLGINILAATLIRFPWRSSQVGFVTTHAGLLVLLLGSIQTFVSGIEGQLAFVEGEAAERILMAGRSQLKVATQRPGGWQTTEFSFFPGPVDWPGGKLLDFGDVDGVRVRVLKFYRHARQEQAWVADETRRGQPAIQLAIFDSGRQPAGEVWVAANPFGGRPVSQSPNFDLQQAPLASMLDDFLKPVDIVEGKGLLSVHHNNRVYPVFVEENLNKKVPIGDSGISVEIGAYYANAVSEGGGRFTSAGAAPKNPMLQLQIHLGDGKEPISEIAFAKNPLVSYELMRGQACPVKFWYHHPHVPVPSGAEFLQTPDGKLYCRVGIDGERRLHGEVREGDRIQLAEGSEALVVRHLPHARQEVRFYAMEPAAGESEGPEAAALVELAAKEKTQQVWLKRGDQQHGLRKIETPPGPLLVSFGYEQIPLGFSLKLLDFKRGMNPGEMGVASFASHVQLVDTAQGINRNEVISMNSPLVHGKYTFYQSSYRDLPDGREVSVLSVAYDPGRFLKYLGSLMICVGIFLMICMKSLRRERGQASPPRS